MAIVECKGCGTRRVVGFMPTTTCGLLLLPGFGVAAASGFTGVDYFQEVHAIGRNMRDERLRGVRETGVQSRGMDTQE